MKSLISVKKIFVFLCLSILIGCNFKLFVSKNKVVESIDGYLMFLRDDIIFFPTADTVNEVFLTNSHVNGFKIDSYETDWLKNLSQKYDIEIGRDSLTAVESISIIPVSLRYYLGDVWQKNSDKIDFEFRFSQQKHRMTYKVYDFRNILLISTQRKSDTKRILSTNK